jgi:hypothetical protein
MTNFRTGGDHGLLDHWVKKGFTLNKRGDGITHDPEMVGEVMAHAEEFFAQWIVHKRSRTAIEACGPACLSANRTSPVPLLDLSGYRVNQDVDRPDGDLG